MHKVHKIKYDWTGLLWFILMVVYGIALDNKTWR